MFRFSSHRARDTVALLEQETPDFILFVAPASMDKISRTMNTEFREQHTFKIERSKYNNKIHNI